MPRMETHVEKWKMDYEWIMRGIGFSSRRSTFMCSEHVSVCPQNGGTHSKYGSPDNKDYGIRGP